MRSRLPPKPTVVGNDPPPGTWTLDHVMASRLFPGVPRETLRVKLRSALTDRWWKRLPSTRTPTRLYDEAQVRALRQPIMEAWRPSLGPKRRSARSLDLTSKRFHATFPLPQGKAGALPDHPPPGFAEPTRIADDMVRLGLAPRGLCADLPLREQPDWRKRIIRLWGPQALEDLIAFAGPDIEQYAPSVPVPSARFLALEGRRPLAFHVERARVYLIAYVEMEEVARRTLPDATSLDSCPPWFPFLLCGLRLRCGPQGLDDLLVSAHEEIARELSPKHPGAPVGALLQSMVERYWYVRIAELADELPGYHHAGLPRFRSLGVEPRAATDAAIRGAMVRWIDGRIPSIGVAPRHAIASALLEEIELNLGGDRGSETPAAFLERQLGSKALTYSSVLIAGAVAYLRERRLKGRRPKPT